MGRKIILEHDGTPNLKDYEVYRKLGGYRAVEKALKTMSPADVMGQVKIAGLRGRGGAGFPTALKWSFLAHPEGKPIYLLCNADESEPGTFKDRYMMQYNPHFLIDGMICSAYAIGAHTSYIYVRGEYKFIIRILEKALQEAYANGWLGKNILGSGYDLDIYVHSGAGAYICGEETALIESLEGKKGYPRMKPPFPAVAGLYGCPTVVNNVESLAVVAWIIQNGGEEYAKIGVGRSTGTKLISASGNIKNPGVYEIELGLSVNEFLYSDEYCGGMQFQGRDLKAIVAGGSSVPVLPKNLILKTAAGEDRLMTYESLSEGGFETGTMLGSGGFIVYDEAQCMVRNTWNFSRFYHDESCGQCSPCREGTGWLEKVLHRLEHGEGNERDIDQLVAITKKIEGNTICPFGDAASWPVASAVRHFRHEFEYHVKYREKVKNRKHFETEPMRLFMNEFLKVEA